MFSLLTLGIIFNLFEGCLILLFFLNECSGVWLFVCLNCWLLFFYFWRSCFLFPRNFWHLFTMFQHFLNMKRRATCRSTHVSIPEFCSFMTTCGYFFETCACIGSKNQLIKQVLLTLRTNQCVRINTNHRQDAGWQRIPLLWD